MIYTKFKYLKTLQGLNENLDKAIDYLKGFNLNDLVMGRNEVDGDRIFINRFRYETKPVEQTVFEAHEKYLDIHLLLSGTERIGISDIADMEVIRKDEANDGIDCRGPVQQMINMKPGDVLIAFPEDAHMVKIQCADICQVEKAVVKVLLK